MEKPEFVYITYIRTTPVKLWEALTDPAQTRQYWGGMINRSDWAKGSRWEHVNEQDSDPLYVFGEILESKPPTRLVLSWMDPENPDDASVVTLDLQPIDDLVRLTVIHGNFKGDSAMQGRISKGWPLVLSSLKSFLETGSSIDIMKSARACE
ncbi:MAG: SRPBCC family protein [Verrucomicrobiae bacterium]|nr:SRPBCC family protein [Verrucomicrobiae bacterium]